MDLTGKRALVTGASRGIGAAIATALAKAGADVAITFEHSADKAADVVRSIEAAGRRGVSIQADSRDADAIARSVEEAAQALGGLDILVNNAGIARQGGLADNTLDDIDAMIAINIRAVVLTSRAALPHLGRDGRIVTIGSNVAERVPMPGLTVYSMTKSAILSFTRGLARDLGPQGITVNIVQPGPTNSDMNPENGQHSDAMRSFMALGRYGQPDDIANAVVFLASPFGRQITGTALTVDGGFNA